MCTNTDKVIRSVHLLDRFDMSYDRAITNLTTLKKTVRDQVQSEDPTYRALYKNYGISSVLCHNRKHITTRTEIDYLAHETRYLFNASAMLQKINCLRC